MNDKYITVTQLTRYIKYKIDNDVNLNEVFLKGEISNFKAHSRGHFYFTLKDETSRINAIMFASNTKKIKFMPEDGMKVLVTGKISVFEANGGYQIYVHDMLEDGVGNLYIAFEQLKKKLEQEGLFRKEYKKQIPKIPTRVGVVTAPTGAAIKDIISTIKRRWPLAEIILFSSLVQGENAKEDIVRQIEKAKDYNLDTLIVGRGGGSIEDLWPFNEEIVARSIFECNIPIISAVGHEIDFTIADFVADLRAPTPSAAAELAVPDIYELHKKIMANQERLRLALLKKLELMRLRYEKCMSSSVFREPTRKINENYIKLDGYIKQMEHLMKMKHEKEKNKYMELVAALDAYSPLKTLYRGYSIIEKDGKIIKSKEDLKQGDIIDLRLVDGKKQAQIK